MKTPQVWRVKGEKVVIHYRLMMTKFRVQPIKYVTIPRLKLMAAVLAMTISQVVRREMDISLIQVTNYCSGQIDMWTCGSMDQSSFGEVKKAGWKKL